MLGLAVICKLRKGSVSDHDIRWETSKYKQLHCKAKFLLEHLALYLNWPFFLSNIWPVFLWHLFLSIGFAWKKNRQHNEFRKLLYRCIYCYTRGVHENHRHLYPCDEEIIQRHKDELLKDAIVEGKNEMLCTRCFWVVPNQSSPRYQLRLQNGTLHQWGNSRKVSKHLDVHRAVPSCCQKYYFGKLEISSFFSLRQFLLERFCSRKVSSIV